MEEPKSAPVTAIPMRPPEEDIMTATVAPVRLPSERLTEAAAVLGQAVVDDPLFLYVLPDAQQRILGVPMMMEMFLRLGLAHGEAWATPPPIGGSPAGSLLRIPPFLPRIATRLGGGRSRPRGAARQ